MQLAARAAGWEAFELEQSETLVGFIRLREMAQHAFKRERFARADMLEQFAGLVPANAVAIHPCVDLQMDRHTLARARGQLAKLFHRGSIAYRAG